MTATTPEPEYERESFTHEDTYPRSALSVLRLYREGPTGRFFYTPDGVGVLWYEDYQEAMAQVGDFGRPVITIMSALED